ncbi:MAG TPA: exodeoxyribonuclease VII small subunit [Candidatus Blautia merdavium]|uniref:Exodeoxyribonuclease 7 small subunit n=1 Tax=Candidatus Blautia merdavium TaxID=2838494 RepID=A0A9D2TB64_9FIRM|nr:exodeoxyribonuclease VII small subunit [Candidatus Blautia merdavium]
MADTEKTTQEPTIEESLKELDSIVERLESREISLEDSFVLYQQGMELLKKCSGRIDAVEKKMLKINEDGELSEF